jgi:hypothetical protein
MGVEQLNELGEVGQRSCQPVDFVDHDDVKLPRPDIVQQSLQIGPVGRATGVTAVVIAGPDQSPAGMGLTPYVCRAGFILGIKRIELLIEALVGGDPRVNRAADCLDRWALHSRASRAD